MLNNSRFVQILAILFVAGLLWALITGAAADVNDPPELESNIRAQWAMNAVVEAYAKRSEIPRERASRIVYAVDFYAHKYRLDPWLVLGVIQTESSGDPKAISHKEAIGLMQLMPKTATWLAEKLDQPKPTREDLFDIHTNIWYGTYYLALLVEQFEDPEVALAAYYWGPTYVKSLQKRGLKIPFEYSERVYKNAYGY